jgi:hypothetical protein
MQRRDDAEVEAAAIAALVPLEGKTVQQDVRLRLLRREP